MKNQMERWIILPFSMGCASKSSVVVESTNCLKETKNSSIVKAKSSFKIFKFRKSSFARGFHRLIRSLRSASQIFSYRDEEEEFEPEIEIGFPTDVKHLLHIGRDGSTITNPCKSLENTADPEMVSFPSVSLKQLEAAMAAQAKQPVVEINSSKLG